MRQHGKRMAIVHQALASSLELPVMQRKELTPDLCRASASCTVLNIPHFSNRGLVENVLALEREGHIAGCTGDVCELGSVEIRRRTTGANTFSHILETGVDSTGLVPASDDLDIDFARVDILRVHLVLFNVC